LNTKKLRHERGWERGSESGLKIKDGALVCYPKEQEKSSRWLSLDPQALPENGLSGGIELRKKRMGLGAQGFATTRGKEGGGSSHTCKSPKEGKKKVARKNTSCDDDVTHGKGSNSKTIAT